jgi:hypothetical protein
MANPSKQESQMADKNDKPMITEQQSLVADLAITFTSNDPSITPDGSVTVADGSTPTVSELLEYCEELNAKVKALADIVEAHGLMADA